MTDINHDLLTLYVETVNQRTELALMVQAMEFQRVLATSNSVEEAGRGFYFPLVDSELWTTNTLRKEEPNV